MTLLMGFGVGSHLAIVPSRYLVWALLRNLRFGHSG